MTIKHKIWTLNSSTKMSIASEKITSESLKNSEEILEVIKNYYKVFPFLWKRCHKIKFKRKSRLKMIHKAQVNIVLNIFIQSKRIWLKLNLEVLEIERIIHQRLIVQRDKEKCRPRHKEFRKFWKAQGFYNRSPFCQCLA
jgi:hypothetical protein